MLSRSARAETRQSSKREVKRVMQSEDKVFSFLIIFFELFFQGFVFLDYILFIFILFLRLAAGRSNGH